MAKTQNPSVYDPQFKEVTVPSLADFVDEDRGKILLYPIDDLKKCLSKTEQLRPSCSTLFILTVKWKKRVFQKIISFWIRSLISHTCQSATDEDCRAVNFKLHKVQKIGTSLLIQMKLFMLAGTEG